MTLNRRAAGPVASIWEKARAADELCPIHWMQTKFGSVARTDCISTAKCAVYILYSVRSMRVSQSLHGQLRIERLRADLEQARYVSGRLGSSFSNKRSRSLSRRGRSRA
jgi:predicted nucleotidyltransferase